MRWRFEISRFVRRYRWISSWNGVRRSRMYRLL
nr:MAG TPA: hypothetical protein [Caudoviricetes sp.]